MITITIYNYLKNKV